MKRNHIFALLLMASMPVMAQQKDSVDIGAIRVFSCLFDGGNDGGDIRH